MSAVTKVGRTRHTKGATTPDAVRNVGPVAASGARVPIAATPAVRNRIALTSRTVVASGIAPAAPVAVVPATEKVASAAVSAVAVPIAVTRVVSGVVVPIAVTRVVSGVVDRTVVTRVVSGADRIGRTGAIAVGSDGPGIGVIPVGRAVRAVTTGGTETVRRVDTAVVRGVRTRVAPIGRVGVRDGTAIVPVVTTAARDEAIAGDLLARSRTIVGARSLGAVRIGLEAMIADEARAAVSGVTMPISVARVVAGRVATVVPVRTVAVAGKARNSVPEDAAPTVVRRGPKSPRFPRMCRQRIWIRAFGAIC